MNRFFSYSFTFLVIVAIVSCGLSGSKPETVFTKVGLNGNKIPRSFQRAFKEMRGQKAVDRLVIYVDGKSKQASVSEYVDYHYKNLFDEDIKGIEQLAVDEETKPIIDAGLAMFRFADEIYKNDYPRIAKMIDDGQPDEAIESAIAELDIAKGSELDKLRTKTMDLLIPYADKHGVEYKTIKMP